MTSFWVSLEGGRDGIDDRRETKKRYGTVGYMPVHSSTADDQTRNTRGSRTVDMDGMWPSKLQWFLYLLARLPNTDPSRCMPSYCSRRRPRCLSPLPRRRLDRKRAILILTSATPLRQQPALNHSRQNPTPKTTTTAPQTHLRNIRRTGQHWIGLCATSGCSTRHSYCTSPRSSSQSRARSIGRPSSVLRTFPLTPTCTADARSLAGNVLTGGDISFGGVDDDDARRRRDGHHGGGGCAGARRGGGDES